MTFVNLDTAIYSIGAICFQKLNKVVNFHYNLSQSISYFDVSCEKNVTAYSKHLLDLIVVI